MKWKNLCFVLESLEKPVKVKYVTLLVESKQGEEKNEVEISAEKKIQVWFITTCVFRFTVLSIISNS